MTNTLDATTAAFLESLIKDITCGDVRITSMTAQRSKATIAWERAAPSAPPPALQPPLAGQHVTRCACGGSFVDTNDGLVCEDCGAA